MKKCISCGINKNLDEFYYRKENGKYRNKCKECFCIQYKNKYLNDVSFREKKNEQAKNYSKRHTEILRVKKSLYRIKNPDKVRKWVNRYYEDNKEKIMFKNNVYEKNNPIKKTAHHKVKYAVKNGNLISLPCIVCGGLKTMAHHEDYTKPLKVIWLCARHHYIYEKNKKYKENRL